MPLPGLHQLPVTAMNSSSASGHDVEGDLIGFDAATRLLLGGEGNMYDQFHYIEPAMQTIAIRAMQDYQYLKQVHANYYYFNAILFLCRLILVQPNDQSAWYDVQAKLIRFLHLTADHPTLKRVRKSMEDNEPAKQLRNALPRFATAASARGDEHMSEIAYELRSRT